MLYKAGFGRIACRFSFVESETFEDHLRKFCIRYKTTIDESHRKHGVPKQRPKLEIQYAADPDKPTSIDPQNEAGMMLQVVNGVVLGELGSNGSWDALKIYIDTLVSCYKDFFNAKVQEFVVLFQAIHKIKKPKGTKNYDVLARLVPSILTEDSVFSSVYRLGTPKIQRTDFKCTYYFAESKCEVTFDIECPANDENTAMWSNIMVRSPQEELADENLFSLEKIEPSLASRVELQYGHFVFVCFAMFFTSFSAVLK